MAKLKSINDHDDIRQFVFQCFGGEYGAKHRIAGVYDLNVENNVGCDDATEFAFDDVMDELTHIMNEDKIIDNMPKSDWEHFLKELLLNA